MKSQKVETGFMAVMWRVTPAFVDENVCNQLKPEPRAGYCLYQFMGRKAQIGLVVSLEKLAKPTTTPRRTGKDFRNLMLFYLLNSRDTMLFDASKERKYHPFDKSKIQASTLPRNSATTIKHAAKKLEGIEKTFASMAH